jgi:hypothetical protein
MNNKGRTVFIKQINHLQESTADSATVDNELVIFNFLRKWPLRVAHDHFRFVGLHAVVGDVVAIPVDPAELPVALVVILPII